MRSQNSQYVKGISDRFLLPVSLHSAMPNPMLLYFFKGQFEFEGTWVMTTAKNDAGTCQALSFEFTEGPFSKPILLPCDKELPYICRKPLIQFNSKYLYHDQGLVSNYCVVKVCLYQNTEIVFTCPNVLISFCRFKISCFSVSSDI